jgi:virginiamycin A acetyltransferase
MLKLIANIFFSIFLNSYKKFNASYDIRLSPDVFIRLIRSKNKRINLRNVIIGRGVEINEGCSFFNNPEMFGNVILDKYVSVSGPSTRICGEINKVTIGAFSSIASNVIIQEFYHNYNLPTTYNILNNYFGVASKPIFTLSKGDIQIGEDVWIGSNSVILSGVKIGRGAVVGAGSVVTKNVEPYSIVAGNPAVKIKMRFSLEAIDKLESMRWWNWDFETMNKNRNFFSEDVDDKF